MPGAVVVAQRARAPSASPRAPLADGVSGGTSKSSPRWVWSWRIANAAPSSSASMRSLPSRPRVCRIPSVRGPSLPLARRRGDERRDRRAALGAQREDARGEDLDVVGVDLGGEVAPAPPVGDARRSRRDRGGGVVGELEVALGRHVVAPSAARIVVAVLVERGRRAPDRQPLAVDADRRAEHLERRPPRSSRGRDQSAAADLGVLDRARDGVHGPARYSGGDERLGPLGRRVASSEAARAAPRRARRGSRRAPRWSRTARRRRAAAHAERAAQGARTARRRHRDEQVAVARSRPGRRGRCSGGRCRAGRGPRRSRGSPGPG